MDIKKILLTWGVALLSCVFNVYGTLMLKYVLNNMGDPRFETFSTTVDYATTLLKSPLALSAMLALLISTVFMLMAYSQMEVTIAFPAIMGMNFMFVAILGILLLGEAFTIPKIIGMVLVLGSIFCFTR